MALVEIGLGLLRCRGWRRRGGRRRGRRRRWWRRLRRRWTARAPSSSTWAMRPGGDGGFGGGGGDGVGNSGGFGGGTRHGNRAASSARGSAARSSTCRAALDIRNSTLAENADIGGEDAVPDLGKGMGGAVFNLTGELRVVGSTLDAQRRRSGGAAIYNLAYDGDRARQAFTSCAGRSPPTGSDPPTSSPTRRPRPLARQPGLRARRRRATRPRRHGRRARRGHDLRHRAERRSAARPFAVQRWADADDGAAATSPAIDASLAFALTTDQRGQPRPFDSPFAPNRGDGSDIGAVELQATRCTPRRRQPPGESVRRRRPGAAASETARAAFGARTS